MVADVLMTLGATALTAMILSELSYDILVSAPEGLKYLLSILI